MVWIRSRLTPDGLREVKISYSIDLRLVAECVDATPAELEELNPGLLRMVTPKGHFDLHLPVGTVDKFQSTIASIPADMRVWWRYHQVASGETLMRSFTSSSPPRPGMVRSVMIRSGSVR